MGIINGDMSNKDQDIKRQIKCTCINTNTKHTDLSAVRKIPILLTFRYHVSLSYRIAVITRLLKTASFSKIFGAYNNLPHS